MAITPRSNNLFPAEDWKKLYTTFSDADFQSFDFETIRKVMVDYLRTYYAEGFNDFIESDEYIALLDTVSFIAQGLAFRTDLNARENFLATAERRDSVLKLVKQLSYSPNRNKAASGLLKMTSISTSESVFDTNGTNLSNRTVVWNDAANPSWASQFTLILNAIMSSTQKVGRPYASKQINGIKTDQYSIAIPATVLPVFPFTAPVQEVNSPFEAVSATITNSDTIGERDPGVRGDFGFIFQNDGRGNSSANTGFYFYFKQGSLQSVDFALQERIPNRVFAINTENVNNDDIWLYNIDNGGLGKLWTKVPSTNGNNAIYNSTARGIRTIYSVGTRMNDQIDLVFGDGTFADMPQGNYRTYYRVSNGQTYRIPPTSMSGITIAIPYVSRSGRNETVTITLSLQYTVSNSSRRDLTSEIKAKAPQFFYTQGRMVNGEDYNVFPYTQFPDIVKVKSINRYSTGVSRQIDIVDPTGKYSSTDIVATDGAVYLEPVTNSFVFSSNSQTDTVRAIRENLQAAMNSTSLKHYFYHHYSLVPLTQTATPTTWDRTTNDAGSCTGFFLDQNSARQQIGVFTSSLRKYLLIGSMIRFDAPGGFYFDAGNTLIAGVPKSSTDRRTIWATITSQSGNGSTPLFFAGREIGAVTLSENIPTGAVATYVYAPLTNELSQNVTRAIISAVASKINFGLRYDATRLPLGNDPWVYVSASSLDTTSEFDILTAGTASDSSWLFWFQSDGSKYTVRWRGLEYIFTSPAQVRFLESTPEPVYDARTNSTFKDHIRLLATNVDATGNGTLGNGVAFDVAGLQVASDGYVDNSKVQVTYQSRARKPLPVDPIVFEDTIGSDGLIFLEQYVDYDNLVRFQLLDTGAVSTAFATKAAIDALRNTFAAGKIFYATSENKFYVVTLVNSIKTITETQKYVARTGRQDLIFQYRHNATNSRRIDPAASNLIDCYVMTRSYDDAYRAYIVDATNSIAKPVDVSNTDLTNSYNELLQYKMMTDQLILTPGTYKPLFGNKADPALQGVFQIVKSASTNVSDNEIKSMLVAAINGYFQLDNWDFGDTFYFSELSAYLHQTLSQYISSVILLPATPQGVFGSLYEIRCQPNEIFISAATVDNIDVVAGVLVGITQSGTIAASTTGLGI